MCRIFLIMFFFFNMVVNAADNDLSLDSLDLKGKQFKVLFVEDNSLAVRCFFKFVEKINDQGYKIDVVSADNRTDAVSRYAGRTGPFDLILMDLCMPQKAGDKVGSECEGIRAAQEIRALGYTGVMLAVTSEDSEVLERLQGENPSLFREWRGKIQNIQDLQGMLDSIG